MKMVLDTKLEKEIALKLFRDISVRYNSSNIAKVLNKTRMGTFKALKELERKLIIKGETLGKARFYDLNLKDEFVKKNIEVLLMEESRKKQRWINEFEEIFKYAEIVIIFGSIIRDEKKAKDIDLLIVLKQENNNKINSIIKDKNKILLKKIHPIKQTMDDLKNNLKKHDKVVLNALKFGAVLHGFDRIVEVVRDVTNKK